MLTTNNGVILNNVKVTKLLSYNDTLQSFKEHILSSNNTNKISLYFMGYSCRNEIARRRDATVDLMTRNGMNGIHAESAVIFTNHLEDVCKEIKKRQRIISVYDLSTFIEYNREIRESENRDDLELNPLLLTIYDFNMLLEESRPEVRLKACKLLQSVILQAEQVGIYIILCERGLKNLLMLIPGINWNFGSI